MANIAKALIACVVDIEWTSTIIFYDVPFAYFSYAIFISQNVYCISIVDNGFACKRRANSITVKTVRRQCSN